MEYGKLTNYQIQEEWNRRDMGFKIIIYGQDRFTKMGDRKGNKIYSRGHLLVLLQGNDLNKGK